jgi:hypothetical protein
MCDRNAAAEPVAKVGKAAVYGAREGGGKGVSDPLELLGARSVSRVVRADGYCIEKAAEAG